MCLGVLPHAFEALPVAILSAELICVLTYDCPALPLREVSQLQELIKRILAFVVG